ncbi:MULTISPECIES: MATE family efflux transporter [Clostridium]|uniref:MATE family efflux transporter n=1 Tax=Clostridium TaxID=1485 RepID=UPI0008255BFE|nr:MULTISPECIES: MATE family efflux transporter [Clostridium]PJI08544.1 MATE family efflux transporter [Clostridium sp. CT7]
MSNVNEMESGNIKKLLLKFSVPSIISMLANAVYNVCDKMFVGIGVGVLGISAVTISYTVTLVILGFSMLVGLGATSLVSINLGQNDIKKCETIVGNTFILSFIVSIILMILGYSFLTPMLALLGAKGKVLSYAVTYTGIIILGTPFQVLNCSMNNILKGQGKAKMAMVNCLISIILNIIFNPLFIFVFHMGIAGSAVATVISTAIGAIFSTSPYFAKNSNIRIHFENLKLKKDIIISSFSIGTSGFVMVVALALINIIINKQCLVYGGNMAVAAFGIIYNVNMLVLMPVTGINQGVQPIIGYNYGAKRYGKILKAFKLSVLFGTIISLIGFVLFEVFSKNIFYAFGQGTKELIVIGVPAMRLYSMSLPILGFMILGASYFQYVGKAKYSIILIMLRQVIVIMPMLIILPKFMKITGLWIATPITDLISVIILLGFICPEIKKLSSLGNAEAVQCND